MTELAHDWLVISHLDEDHINGIGQLEEAKVTFTNVFLPHVDLVHSMFLMLLRMAGLAAVGTATLDAIRIAGRLYAGAYGRVHIVVPGDPDTYQNAPRPDGLPDLMPPNISAPSELLDGAARQRLAAGSGRFVSDTESICLDGVDWQFRFYSQEWHFPVLVQTIWNLPELDALRVAINKLKLLGTGDGSAFTNEIQTALDTYITGAQATTALRAIDPRHAAVTKKTSINSLLKMLYKAAPGLHDYNSSSLCMYAGPIGRTAERRQWFNRQTSLAMRDHVERGSTRTVGWLGMGDAHFHTADELARFRNHYRGELRLLSTLMLPHHGSRHNYDSDRVQLHGLLASLPVCPAPALVVASNPAHKKFRHPHTEVVETGNRYGVVHNVSLDARSVFEESIWTDCRCCCP